MKQGTKGKLTDNLTSYLFVAPYLVFFIIFALVPLVLCIYLSFCQWDGASEIEWIGLQNYKLLFGALGTGQIAKEFWKSVLNTLLFVAVQMPVLMILPLLIALLINRCSRTGKFFMSAFYFPSILSVATVCIIWYFMFDTNAGILNNFFKTNIPWITKQPYAWISIFILSSWWGSAEIWSLSCGLSNVSKECLEAAALERSGRLGLLHSYHLARVEEYFGVRIDDDDAFLFQCIRSTEHFDGRRTGFLHDCGGDEHL